MLAGSTKQVDLAKQIINDPRLAGREGKKKDSCGPPYH